MEATCTRVSILHFRELLITLVAQFGVALRGDEEFFGLLGEGLHQGVVADLAHNEVAELAPVGLLRVEVEAVLAHRCGVVGRADTLLFLSRVVVPEVPVAALDGLLLLVLRAAHTDLDAVVDAGCVADDERRAVVGLGHQFCIVFFAFCIGYCPRNPLIHFARAVCFFVSPIPLCIICVFVYGC